MNFFDSEDTIISCSSGQHTNVAVSLIRISGAFSFADVRDFFSIKDKNYKFRYSYFTNLIFSNAIVDEVIAVFFNSPNSYTGENVIEISVHGNQLNVSRIINIFCDCEFARQAFPGEFTYRAFRNNKLNLSQVEGLDLLLNANNIFSLDQGLSIMSGKLQDSYLDLRSKFLAHKSALEFSFDFAEDMGEERARAEFDKSLNLLVDSIEALSSRVLNNANRLISPEIVLFGQPNAGKSTLFNKLLGDNRAIVSEIAGTTRDYISEQLNLDGSMFRLVDTAGLRDSTADIIEKEGVFRSLEILKKSFFNIFVINPANWNNEFNKLVKNTSVDLFVFTHSDDKHFKSNLGLVLKDLVTCNFMSKEGSLLVNNSFLDSSFNIDSIKCGPIEPAKNGPIEPAKNGPIEPAKNGPIEPVKNGPIEPALNYIFVNLLDKDSLKARNAIQTLVLKKYLNETGNVPIILERHTKLLTQIQKEIHDYKDLACTEGDVAILSSELNNTGHCISELIGIVSADDVLNNIFDNFCIGK